MIRKEEYDDDEENEWRETLWCLNKRRSLALSEDEEEGRWHGFRSWWWVKFEKRRPELEEELTSRDEVKWPLHQKEEKKKWDEFKRRMKRMKRTWGWWWFTPSSAKYYSHIQNFWNRRKERSEEDSLSSSDSSSPFNSCQPFISSSHLFKQNFPPLLFLLNVSFQFSLHSIDRIWKCLSLSTNSYIGSNFPSHPQSMSRGYEDDHHDDSQVNPWWLWRKSRGKRERENQLVSAHNF